MRMILSFLILLFTMVSCTKTGCTNPDATNYKKRAQEDDGSCVYPEYRDDLIGEYAVEIHSETFVGPNQGVSNYYDTILIEKANYYNRLKIDNHNFIIEFNTGKLKYSTNEHHSPPTGSGYLFQNQLSLTQTSYMLFGGRINTTSKIGYKIN